MFQRSSNIHLHKWQLVEPMIVMVNVSKPSYKCIHTELIIVLTAGRVTNLVVVSRSSLLPTSKNKRVSNEYTISPLDKYPPLSNSIRGTTTLHSLGPPNGGNQTSIDSGSSTQKIFDTQVFSLFLNSLHANLTYM